MSAAPGRDRPAQPRPLPAWAARMRGRRLALGISQKRLARALGCAQSRVGRWETGMGAPRPEQLLEIARLLGIPVQTLIGPDSGPADTPEGSDSG